MADRSSEFVGFSRLEIENWRNFKSAAVELSSRAFLVGPNASGKSNLLDVFKFLRDLASEGGGLAKAISDRGGVSSIRNLAARKQPAVHVIVEAIDSDRVHWRYKLSFKQDSQRRPTIDQEELWKGETEIFTRPNQDDLTDPQQLTQTHVEQVGKNRQFRALVDLFKSVRYLHVVPQLIRDPDRYRGRREDPFGWDILERIASTPERTRNAWLSRIQQKLRIAVPQMEGLELFRDARGVPHLRSKYQHWRPQGAWQTEEVFSDGTLRLIGLLWSMLERSGPLLLEEPELSLNPHVVRHIPAMLYEMQKRSGRQVIVSTHSADLLSEGGIGLDEVLLLEPSSEGTNIRPASSVRDARLLLKEGHAISEIVIPRMRLKNAEQLTLEF